MYMDICVVNLSVCDIVNIIQCTVLGSSPVGYTFYVEGCCQLEYISIISQNACHTI